MFIEITKQSWHSQTVPQSKAMVNIRHIITVDRRGIEDDRDSGADLTMVSDREESRYVISAVNSYEDIMKRIELAQGSSIY